MYKIVLAACLATISHAITITVDSFHAGNEAAKAIDNNLTTFWHTEYTPTVSPFPHWAILDLGSSQNLSGFTYTPRQDGNSNGNIGLHTIELSVDNVTWKLVANSTYPDNNSVKVTSFTSTPARYVRLITYTEAGNRGNWSSAAELGVTIATPYSGTGVWGPVISFPLVPAGAFVSHDSGKVVTFASYKTDTFGVGVSGNTYTATYDPVAKTVSELNIQNTGHDMFCPGMSLDLNGRAITTGGDTANKTSIYDPSTSTWSIGATLKIPRGYQASAALSDGRIFTIGGSWSGGMGGKNGEIYSGTTNSWTLLPGCPVAPMLTNDAQGAFRTDNHGWLFGWKNGSVFQAGPSKAMNWYGTTGTGSQTAAGLRGTDPDSMDGNAVMYDAVNGKIFTAGGSPSYQDSNATNNVHLITIGTPGTTPTVATLTSMTYKRAFANGVVLPDGKIIVTGGQSYAVPFSDDTATLISELWDPATQKFSLLPPHAIPRVYHSVALLMIDGTVFTGGGGLCGTCGTNHQDAQIYSPAYLFNSDGTLATRPVISSASTKVIAVGKTFSIVTDSAVSSFSIIRYGSATHTVDTDQRRIALTPTATTGTTYTLAIPADPGIALPGYWMLFVLNAKGVPSVATTIKITL